LTNIEKFSILRSEAAMRARAEIVFPNNLRDFRLKRGLTQAQLGRMMAPPIGESAISKIESGERRLTNLQLADLANILLCRPEDIPVISGRDPSLEVQRWDQMQQEAVGNSILSGAAATGYVLAQLRKKNGKTMQQVANAIGMTLSVYHRVETASRVIQAHEIDAVADFYGMITTELITLFEHRTEENLEKLKGGAAPEQLLPRAPRSLLKDDAKWGQLGALERYAIRRSIKFAAAPAERGQLPVFGSMKATGDGGHYFAIDRDEAVEHIPAQDLIPNEGCFLVRNFSQRLGFFLRPGALAYVDPRRPVAMGDIAFLVRKDGSADAGMVIGDGIGPLMLKMYNPEEQIPLAEPDIAHVWRIGMLILP